MQRYNSKQIREEEWKPYPGGRKIVSFEDYVIIAPEDFDPSKVGMKIFCDVCEVSFSSAEDEKTYKKFGCCSSCADTWAYSYREKWEAGWRPSPEQIKSSVQKRIFTNKDITFV